MGNNGYISDDLKELVEKLIEIQTQAKQLGIFVDDRDLLECAHCHLIEDVAFDGRLFTYWNTDKNFTDTGLRFIELNPDEALFKCPSCGSKITVQKEKEY